MGRCSWLATLGMSVQPGYADSDLFLQFGVGSIHGLPRLFFGRSEFDGYFHIVLWCSVSKHAIFDIDVSARAYRRQLFSALRGPCWAMSDSEVSASFGEFSYFERLRYLSARRE